MGSGGNLRAIVVGASSGIGAAIVRQLAAEGHRVVALARRADELEVLRAECDGGHVLARPHDVTDSAAVPALFEALVRELGGLDLIVYAAGTMPAVGPQEFDTPKDLSMLAVNLLGCVAWLNPAANLFRTQRAGTIVGISSVAGDRGRSGAPAYCTSKAGMTTYLEALRNRLSDSGVHVCTIKPGFVDTRMLAGVEKRMWVISPETAAARILRAALRRVNTRYVPMRWWWVMTVIRAIPSFVFTKLRI